MEELKSNWDKLLKEEIRRLEIGGVVHTNVHELLAKEKLDKDSISIELENELRDAMTRTYSEYMGSSRLQGIGWTPEHITQHMNDWLKDKLGKVSCILRTQKPSEKKGNAFKESYYKV
jgi:hypothetical protein